MAKISVNGKTGKPERKERSGAIVPDAIFRNVDGDMEISWWNDEDINFTNRYGFIIVPADIYKNIIDQLFASYHSLWL